MKIRVINPNTTASMTAKIGTAARAVAAADTEIEAASPAMGPVSIEGFYDEAFAAPGLLGDMAEHPADGYVIACFDDTGLDAARCITARPVVGIGEAGFHVASLVATRFAVVTTLSRSIATIERNLVRYGLAARCACVRASDVPVLELEAPVSDARRRISEEIARAIDDDRAEAIVLGCAGMTDLASSLSHEHGVPVVDGVASAVTLVEGLVRIGLTTSRRGGYASPAAKTYEGMFAPFAPRG